MEALLACQGMLPIQTLPVHAVYEANLTRAETIGRLALNSLELTTVKYLYTFP